MLKNNLDNIPHIVLLNSDKIMNNIIHNLANYTNNDICLDEIYESIRDFYPDTYRLDDMDNALKQDDLQKSNIYGDNCFNLHYSFDFLNSLFNKFFEINGSLVRVKDDILEDYINFIRKISPLHILAYKYSCLINDDKDSVLSFINNHTPFGYKIDKLNKYADNHLHLKGAVDLSFSQVSLFTSPSDNKFFEKDYIQKLPRISKFSYLNNANYTIGQIIEIAKLCTHSIYDYQLSSNVYDIYSFFNENLSKILYLNQPLYECLYNIKNLSDDELGSCLHKDDDIIFDITKLYKKNQFSKCSLLEKVLFFKIYNETKNAKMKLIIKLYLHIDNILRSYMVMSDNIGLSHFIEVSEANLRETQKNKIYTATRIEDSGSHYVNSKTGLKDDIFSSLSVLKYAFDKTKMKYNFGLSLTKEKDKKIKKHSLANLLPRFYELRKNIYKKALKLDNFLCDIRFKHTRYYDFVLGNNVIKAFKHQKKYKKKYFNISNLVHSIDSVGSETSTPPEVFAYCFNFLRLEHKKFTSDILKGYNFDKHQKLIISVHAGEDFNHIITGMRRVDESILFFNMGQNDRLGHIMSLGIFPKQWLKETSSIFIKQGEYLDDLVWLWGKLKKIDSSELDISKYILIYEEKIWKYFHKIYPDSLKVNVLDIHRAWSYRKNCPIKYMERKINGALLDNQDLLEDEPNENVRLIYECYHFDEKVKRKHDKIITIDKKDIQTKELKIWEALQDYMLNELDEKSIIVETNPSSNLFISKMRNYIYHPIFRFHPPKNKLIKKGNKFNKYNQRKGILNITINSDDPTIFVSTLQNEYNTIKNIAKKHYKCSEREAQKWIDDISKHSIKVFKESYVNI